MKDVSGLGLGLGFRFRFRVAFNITVKGVLDQRLGFRGNKSFICEYKRWR